MDYIIVITTARNSR